MASQITFKENHVQLNNIQFSRVIDFGIEIAEQDADAEELPFVKRMKKLRDEEFWPGRGIDIAKDFPETAEQKFWCRIFLNVSRAIFDRRVGVQDYNFWQAQAIHQTHSTGLLFQQAVREIESTWSAVTIDHQEWDDWQKKNGRQH
jgi:hypothetical protein